MRLLMADETGKLSQNLIIPCNTKMEEHTIVAGSDVIIGNKVKLGYGIIGDNIIIGEHTTVEGKIIARQDIRVDLWTKIEGSVQTKSDAYFGEFVNINGNLTVEGNLDVGNNVKIKEGYTAKGWIVVRNPLPVVTFIFLYLMTLLQLGKEEEVEKALEELFSEEGRALSTKLMIIPDNTIISLTEVITPEKVIIDSDCRLFGNIKAKAVYMDDRNNLFGSIRTEGDIFIGTGCNIHGKLESKANVIISRGAHIMGDVDANTVIFHETARISGTIHAPESVATIQDDTNGLTGDELNEYYCFKLLFPELVPGEAIAEGFSRQ